MRGARTDARGRGAAEADAGRSGGRWPHRPWRVRRAGGEAQALQLRFAGVRGRRSSFGLRGRRESDGACRSAWRRCTRPRSPAFAPTRPTLVLVSRDLMIADFMTYRGISIMIARLADAGDWPLLFSAAAQSITQDYAWGPALVPGLALALTQPTSRAVYTFALLALYAAPALLALAILARDLARRAGLRRLPSPQPSPVNRRGETPFSRPREEGGPQGRMRVQRAAGARRRRHFFRLSGRDGGRGARHAGCRRTRAHRLRASTGRAPRPPAGAATRPRRGGSRR